MKTEIGQDIERAARLIREGHLVAFGTETVYGLGANATNDAAVAQIFEAKNRPHFDPLIVHVSSSEMLREVVAEWPTHASQLADSFLPGPLTLVLKKRQSIGDLVTSGLQSVGVRIPALKAARDLIEAAGCPIAAPSANRFGQVSPTTAAHVFEQLEGRVSYIFDTGPCTVGVESTVARIADNAVTLLRPGGVTREDLEAVCGPIALAADSEKGEMQAPDSPGQLPKHYAPAVPLKLSLADHPSPTYGLLAFGRSGHDWPGLVEVLSESGDLREAAARLFAAMRRLVDSGATAIFVDEIPESGLGLAINDRLRRAAASDET